MNVFCFAARRNGRGVLIPPRYPTFPPFSLSFSGTHLKPPVCVATRCFTQAYTFKTYYTLFSEVHIVPGAFVLGESPVGQRVEAWNW
jgi:hypothetical protein